MVTDGLNRDLIEPPRPGNCYWYWVLYKECLVVGQITVTKSVTEKEG
jgi:hypothetical protein